MRPATLNLIGPRAIVQGDPYLLQAQITGEGVAGVDLTGWTFAASLRLRFGATDSFDEEIPTVADFDVDVSAAVGWATVTLQLTAEQTADLDAGRYVWDFQGVDEDGDPHTFLRGPIVTVLGQSTVSEGGT